VETDDDGGTLMLETDEIRAAGDTLSGATAGSEPGNLGRDANRPAGGSAWGGGTQDHGDEEGDRPEPVRQADEDQGPTRGHFLVWLVDAPPTATHSIEPSLNMMISIIEISLHSQTSLWLLIYL